MIKLSAVIIAKNAENDIKDCLDALTWVDEIIVLDNMSADRTPDICREYPNVRVIRKKAGMLFGPYRNTALTETSGDWILIVDPDEIVPPALAEEIREAIKDPDRSGYFLQRKNMFLGEWIRCCGWWPERILRLIRKGAAEWPKEIHGTLTISDKDRLGRLDTPLIHNSYVSLEQYFYKFNFYTTQLALEERQKGTKITAFNFPGLFFIRPAYWFLRKYVLLKGCTEGFRGFFISFSSALVIFVSYAKLWELYLRREE